ncbi:hypothetical protein OJ997_30615 [Solirubrobacter phytolaccae]|uniref:Lipoprotein n=1 Tax=Solirubrobacter phytolaccae TaxID=1404360 RepID=A0A9X3NGT6_9ACTN|nr:hypothetical protein [Solirubrobacter phytolaccae]MDA0184695.1 hypothetical protein [Solirubrobacter phytolaccae]
MKTRLLLAAVAATASFVVACGGEEANTGSPATGADKNKQAMLDFARCMRENGVDMPDPKFEGGRVTMRAGGPGGKQINPDDMRAAEKACAKYQEAIKPPDMSEEEKAENKKAALANARCMRENGVPDFPDPQFDENGGAQIRIGKNLDPEGPAFQKAMKACEKTMPGFGTSGSGEDK